MKTVAKIIETFGGLDWLKAGNYIRLENEPYMRLVIEYVGTGPRGMPVISVAHYYEQNGDAMRDPEVVFEVNPDDSGPRSWRDGDWEPISFQQDNMGIYQEAVFVNDAGAVVVSPKLIRDLKSFARTWDKNIEEQGFLAVAQRQAALAAR